VGFMPVDLLITTIIPQNQPAPPNGPSHTTPCTPPFPLGTTFLQTAQLTSVSSGPRPIQVIHHSRQSHLSARPTNPDLLEAFRICIRVGAILHHGGRRLRRKRHRRSRSRDRKDVLEEGFGLILVCALNY